MSAIARPLVTNFLRLMLANPDTYHSRSPHRRGSFDLPRVSESQAGCQPCGHMTNAYNEQLHTALLIVVFGSLGDVLKIVSDTQIGERTVSMNTSRSYNVSVLAQARISPSSKMVEPSEAGYDWLPERVESASALLALVLLEEVAAELLRRLADEAPLGSAASEPLSLSTFFRWVVSQGREPQQQHTFSPRRLSFSFFFVFSSAFLARAACMAALLAFARVP